MIIISFRGKNDTRPVIRKKYLKSSGGELIAEPKSRIEIIGKKQNKEGTQRLKFFQKNKQKPKDK